MKRVEGPGAPCPLGRPQLPTPGGGTTLTPRHIARYVCPRNGPDCPGGGGGGEAPCPPPHPSTRQSQALLFSAAAAVPTIVVPQPGMARPAKLILAFTLKSNLLGHHLNSCAPTGQKIEPDSTIDNKEAVRCIDITYAKTAFLLLLLEIARVDGAGQRNRQLVMSVSTRGLKPARSGRPWGPAGALPTHPGDPHGV